MDAEHKSKRKTGKGKAKKTCIMFPDCPPRKGKDRTGERYAYLTFHYPVCRCLYDNRPNQSVSLWVATCDCGREVITIFGRSSSCGKCSRPSYRPDKSERIKPVDPSQVTVWRPRKGFDRLKVCTRKEGPIREHCQYFSQCADERLETHQPSERWKSSGGSCYDPTQSEVAAMANQ